MNEITNFWQVFLDACVTVPIVHNEYTARFDPVDPTAIDQSVDAVRALRVNSNNCALICDVRIITDILLDWTVWAPRCAEGEGNTGGSVWLLALRALNGLVRPDHPHLSYNVQILQSAGVVSRILNIFLVCLRFSF